MGNNLAVKLRSGTQKAHTDAENVGFMKCFVKGIVDKECLGKFLGNLYFVYGELEAAISKHQQHPVIKVMYFPQLNRLPFLEKDMLFYYGDLWPSYLKPSLATQKYVARLQQLSTHQPALLLGHAYTRYMGDLSGGQMLQKKLLNQLYNSLVMRELSFTISSKFPINRFLKTSIVKHWISYPWMRQLLIKLSLKLIMLSISIWR